MSAPKTNSSSTNPTIVDKTRNSAAHAAQSTRDTARDAAHSAQQMIESNPVVALLGGIALGAALGALLPKTDIESEHLGPLGRKLTDGAAAAARAAREAGREELSALAPDKDSAKAKAASIFEHVATAAKDSARTAAKA